MKVKHAHGWECFRNKFRHSPRIRAALADKEVIKQEATAQVSHSSPGHAQNNTRETLRKERNAIKKIPANYF